MGSNDLSSSAQSPLPLGARAPLPAQHAAGRVRHVSFRRRRLRSGAGRVRAGDRVGGDLRLPERPAHRAARPHAADRGRAAQRPRRRGRGGGSRGGAPGAGRGLGPASGAGRRLARGPGQGSGRRAGRLRRRGAAVVPRRGGQGRGWSLCTELARGALGARARPDAPGRLAAADADPVRPAAAAAQPEARRHLRERTDPAGAGAGGAAALGGRDAPRHRRTADRGRRELAPPPMPPSTWLPASPRSFRQAAPCAPGRI